MQQRHAFLMLVLVSAVLLGLGCKRTIEGPKGTVTAVYGFGKFRGQSISCDFRCFRVFIQRELNKPIFLGFWRWNNDIWLVG